MSVARTGYNKLSVEVYQPFSTTRRPIDPIGASVESFTTFFPGGMYGTATVFVPYNVTGAIPWQPADRLVIRNGSAIVWEGEITDIGYMVGQGAEQGLVLPAVGHWGGLLGRRTINRKWCITSTAADVWKPNTTASGAEKATLDRTSRLRWTPKGVQWATTEVAWCSVAPPTGESWGRIRCDRDFQEAAQAWSLTVQDAASNVFWTLTASTTDAGVDTDHPSTPVADSNIQLRFANASGGNQTPTEDGTYYGQISKVFLYRYPGTDATVPNVRIDNIVKNCQAAISQLNSDTVHIATPGTTFDIEPFFTKGSEPWSDVLARAASYGDGAFNEWYIRLLHSENAQTPDGKPVIECAQYGALTSYDYGVRIGAPNVVGRIQPHRSVIPMANYLVMQYTDDNGDPVELTPDDNAALKATGSITDWQQRDLIVSLGNANSTTAASIAQKILARSKFPQWFVQEPITVAGYIEDSAGAPVPASEIQPGKRLRILNFLDDISEGDTGGEGLTFYITGTQYNDESETCQISTGVGNSLAVILAQLKLKYL